MPHIRDPRTVAERSIGELLFTLLIVCCFCGAVVIYLGRICVEAWPVQGLDATMALFVLLIALSTVAAGCCIWMTGKELYYCCRKGRCR